MDFSRLFFLSTFNYLDPYLFCGTEATSSVEWSVTLAMADARVDACLAVLLDAAHQISEVNHRVTGRWSAEEERLFVIGVGRYGKRWSVIASHVGTRTGVQVRTHAVCTQWPAGGGRWCGEEGACPHSSPTRSWVLLVGRALTCGSTPSRSVSPSSSVSLSPTHSCRLSPPLSPPLSQQKINKKVAKQTNTETASTAAHGTRRKPRCCGRCRLHGVDVRAEGHQGMCPHSTCGCKPCVKLADTISRRREGTRIISRQREARGGSSG